MSEHVKIEIVKNDFQGNGSTVKFEYQKETAAQSGFVILFEGKYHAYLNQCMHM